MRRCRMAPAAESPARRGHGVGGAADKAVPRKQHPCCRAVRALLGQAQLQPQRSKKTGSVAEYWEAAQIPWESWSPVAGQILTVSKVK